MDVKILIATHKKYQMPEDNTYMPIRSGSVNSESFGYLRDDSGDNISFKHKNYSELTSIYWAWKNLNCDIVGLVHYRRFFSDNTIFKILITKDKYSLILSEYEIKKLLSQYDIILPKKRNYYIETVYEHYKKNHYEKDLLKIKKIIMDQYPDYISSFNKVMNGKKLYIYNMFISKKDLFNEYCKWLFNILFELENEIDVSSYDNYQSRIFGFLSERLFTVWIDYKKLNVYECNISNIEKVNWIKKIYKFFKNKISK